jgi:hypothetical protein
LLDEVASLNKIIGKINFDNTQNFNRIKMKITKLNILLFVILNCLVVQSAYGKWINQYKKGVISIKPESEFSIKTVWEDILFNTNHEIAIAGNGTIFMTNTSENNFFVISVTGDIQKRVSQSGQGPGDLTAPKRPQLLDEKYLVVTENAELKRISIFNLSSGKFLKILRTNKNPFGTVALKNNKIAYYSSKCLSNELAAKSITQYSVYIKNIQTNEEKLVFSTNLNKYGNRVEGVTFSMDAYNDKIFLSSSIDHQLMVGSTNSNRIDIYTENGILVKSINLKLTPIKVTSDLIANQKDFQLKKFIESIPNNLQVRMSSLYKKANFADFFGPDLPLFSYITTDSDGNLLVFKFPIDQGSTIKTFQVYSKDGIYLCETQLNCEKFNISLNSNWQHLFFTKDGIIGIFSMEKEDDTIYKLIRVKRSR